MAVEETNLTEAQAKYYMLVRRLHSLTGLVPVGVFLCVHLVTNASVLVSADGAEFQQAVERIHALGPLLVPVEIVGIFIPMLFHAIVGIQIMLTSMPNPQHYRYGSNIRYTLQRATGMIAFAFILYHVWQMHWLGASLGGGHFELHNEAGAATGALTAAKAIQAGWWIAPIYGIGVIATVFHLANGIWTSLITWGITIKPQTQRVSGYACIVFGILLCGVGLGALRGFKTFNTGGATATDRAPAAITASLDEH
ncbi:MAG: succinate dehydrogenase [Planctomycetes bacterium]|nr:succinate dehydrogenase [Planctomycetota bacterium]